MDILKDVLKVKYFWPCLQSFGGCAKASSGPSLPCMALHLECPIQVPKKKLFLVRKSCDTDCDWCASWKMRKRSHPVSLEPDAPNRQFVGCQSQ